MTRVTFGFKRWVRGSWKASPFEVSACGSRIGAERDGPSRPGSSSLSGHERCRGLLVWLAAEARTRASRGHGDTVDSDGCDLVVSRQQHRRDVEPVRESALITLVDAAIGSAARHELMTRTEALNLLDGVCRAVRDTASEPAVASIVNTALAESAGKPTIDRRRLLDALLDIRWIASTLPVDYSKGSSN